VPTSSNLPGFAFTLLSLADGSRCAVKTLTRQPDGTIDSSEYDNGFEWWSKPFNIGADFDKHARLLRRYAQIDRVIMCMGDPKSGIDFNFYHQRLWARDDPPENTMVAVSRAWMPIDVDDAPVPPGLGAPGRYVEGAIHVRDKMLPEEFHGCTMVVSPSARTGLRGPALLRCRMWFLLDRPQELLALKAWTRGLKAVAGVGDSAVCQAGQPIYTGRARFVGMDDPIPPQLRAAVVRERMERVALAADRYAPAIVEIDRKLIAASEAAGDDWRGFLDKTIGGELSFFEPLSMGLGLAARSDDADGEVVRFTLSLIKSRADPARISQYDAQWIGRSLKRFRHKDKNCAVSRETALKRLFRD
jgi:hypothetical protein